MLNVLRSILFELPVRLSRDAVTIVEASPYVDMLIFGTVLAFTCVLLIAISRLLTIKS